ncbi:hypothetical protein [Neptuniibacter sp. QD37_11]|uniref:hypothetical protein n=1 Tax=Neptuniibacter sp. QD37_11 TaxID=3398209 RepID=UPI0039F60DC0
MANRIRLNDHVAELYVQLDNARKKRDFHADLKQTAELIRTGVGHRSAGMKSIDLFEDVISNALSAVEAREAELTDTDFDFLAVCRRIKDRYKKLCDLHRSRGGSHWDVSIRVSGIKEIFKAEQACRSLSSQGLPVAFARQEAGIKEPPYLHILTSFQGYDDIQNVMTFDEATTTRILVPDFQVPNDLPCETLNDILLNNSLSVMSIQFSPLDYQSEDCLMRQWLNNVGKSGPGIEYPHASNHTDRFVGEGEPVTPIVLARQIQAVAQEKQTAQSNDLR